MSTLATACVLTETGFCSLRAAVMEANATAGVEEIRLSAGARYTLDIAGVDEDAAASGDLDITAGVVITGDAVVDAGGMDRVFDIHTTGALDVTEIDGPDLTGGIATDGAAVLVRGTGFVSIMRSDIFSNTGILDESSVVGADSARVYLWLSTLHHNIASHAVLNEGGTLNAQNVTIDSNVGHGIATTSGTTTLVHSTISGNYGHEIVGTADLTASIVDGSCAAAVTSRGYNIEHPRRAGLTTRPTNRTSIRNSTRSTTTAAQHSHATLE